MKRDTTQPKQIIQRLRQEIGKMVHIYTEPSGEVSGKLMEVFYGWIAVQEPGFDAPPMSGPATCLVAIRRIVHFRVLLPKKRTARRKK